MIGFDPVLRDRGDPALPITYWGMDLRERIPEHAGGSLRRFAVRRWVGNYVLSPEFQSEASAATSGMSLQVCMERWQARGAPRNDAC